MSDLSLTVFKDSMQDEMIADWSSLAQDVVYETDEHGFANLTAFIPMPLDEAFRVYDGLQFAHVVLSDGAFTAFEGRLEDPAIVGNDRESGIEITAFGYFRAFSDVPYSAVWSVKETGLDRWRLTTTEEAAGRTPEEYITSKPNGLRLGTRKDQTYTNAADVGAFYFEVPDDSEQDVAYFYIEWTARFPSGWDINVNSATSGWGTVTGEGTIVNCDGSWQSSSTTVTLTANRQIVEILVFNNTGSNDTVEEDSDHFAVLFDNGRILCGASSSSLYADEIVKALITYVNGINSTQIDSSTALVDSPNVDITDAWYEDRTPADILIELAAMGDDSSPVKKYEVGVWEGQRLHFRQLGSQGQDWYTDAASIRVDSTIDTMYNSHYAVYKDYAGDNLRTAISNDTASQSKHSVIRRRAVNTRTSDATEAATWRDAAQEDEKDITPRASITTGAIYTSSGAIINPWQVRAGDTMTIRNLPAGSGGVVDKIRTFRISRTRCYVSEGGRLEVTPGLETPSLEFMVAANAAKGP
jgi:hypothetical protein